VWGEVLELNGVSKIYGHGRGVDNATLTVPDGQFVGIIGRSGAGNRRCCA
jgi:ABC-type multidrug transport system ATPase subunit